MCFWWCVLDGEVILVAEVLPELRLRALSALQSAFCACVVESPLCRCGGLSCVSVVVRCTRLLRVSCDVGEGDGQESG